MPAHTAATDDWVALIELLASGTPDVLRHFDFPNAQRQTFDAILAAAAQLSETAPRPEARTLVLRLLRRLARLVPELLPDLWLPPPPRRHDREPGPCAARAGTARGSRARVPIETHTAAGEKLVEPYPPDGTTTPLGCLGSVIVNVDPTPGAD